MASPIFTIAAVTVSKDGSASPCELRNISSIAFEAFVIKVVGEIGKHPDVIAATLAASKVEGRRSINPLKKKAAEIEKVIKAVRAEIQSCVDVVKKHGANKIGDKFVAEAEALAERQEALEIDREKIQMDILSKQKLVIEEGHVAASLLQFKKLFGTLDFDQQKELVGLLIREIRVSTPKRKRFRSIRASSEPKCELRGITFRFNFT
ncbi:MAG: hypothetical protein ACI9R3_004141 [Verrucomicrobiales bacterium]|jgi:hypothetical protein